MSSIFSLQSDFSDDELPTYEEAALPPNVTIEEREISSEDEEDDDAYQQPCEQKKPITQSTRTFASIKYFLSGTTAPVAELEKSTITFDQAAFTPTRPKADRKPSFKLAPIQASTLQSRRNAMRTAFRPDTTA